MNSHLRRRKPPARNEEEDGRTEAIAGTSSLPQLASDNWVFVLGLSLFIRMFNSFTIVTYFQPDEYYQALEPAHHYVFGYGYVTWEWNEALRSSLHPYLYILGYKVAACLNENAVHYAPKVIGGLIGAFGDAYTYLFVLKFTGKRQVARTALALSYLAPFNWYILTRSFSNSFEMVLTAFALSHWHLEQFHGTEFFLSCFVAMLTCIARPTNGIIWITLGLTLLVRQTPQTALRVLISACFTFLCALGLTTMLDYSFYGRWAFPLYNFIEFNVIKNLSIFYGAAPWHFYIFQAIPMILMTYIPVTLYSVFKHKWYGHPYGVVCLVTIGAFSFVGHKEFRFIYCLQPIFVLFTAVGVDDLFNGGKRYVKPCMTAALLLNIIIAYFFTRVNEKGVIDIVDSLRQDPHAVGFLTPCHSTPWQSHLHNEFFESSWFLTCEPPLHLAFTDTDAIRSYRDESDQFFDSPVTFLQTLGERKTWPECLVVFQPMEDLMDHTLPGYGYTKNRRFFNSHFHWDPRRSGDLIVYCK